MEFLGFFITNEGSSLLPEKVEAILKDKLSEISHKVRIFLGIFYFYRRFLTIIASTQYILHEYLKVAKKRDNRKRIWTD